METMTLDPLTFLLAGQATFTIRNTRTGGRFTYRVERCEDKQTLYFVQVMDGPDNQASYRYLGTLRTDHGAPVYQHGRKSHVAREAQSNLAFAWLITRLSGPGLPAEVELFHMGYCGRCNRPLTVPESIARGLGEICAGKVGLTLGSTA